jgi:hypothetical protein
VFRCRHSTGSCKSSSRLSDTTALIRLDTRFDSHLHIPTHAQGRDFAMMNTLRLVTLTTDDSFQSICPTFLYARYVPS